MRRNRSHLLLYALPRTPPTAPLQSSVVRPQQADLAARRYPGTVRLVNFAVPYYGTNSSCIMASCG